MSSQNSNDIKEFSLLAPDRNGKYFTISGNTSNDLSVDFIVESLTRNSAEKSAISNILCNMPVDKAIIDYRSAIYSELSSAKNFTIYSMPCAFTCRILHI